MLDYNLFPSFAFHLDLPTRCLLPIELAVQAEDAVGG
jgi:hypothetical protein